jgi:nucleoside-diphosphate-sugar epimerase
VAAAFERRTPDGVIHCAAVTSGPEREARDPASVMEVNLQGTVKVLDGARRQGVRRVVYVGSGAAYGESLYRLQRLYEDVSPSVPVSLYGITKHAAERMCLRLAELWDLDIVCARLGTVIGPWERNTGVRDNFGTHSQLALCAATGKEAVLPPREIRRDWVYSRDVAAGLIALLDAQAPRHSVYNLSSGVDWGDSTMTAWCEALETVYNDFKFRVAQPSETANIGYTDKDRCLMDTGRIVNEFGLRLRGPGAAYEDYAQWISRTPDFWSI